MTEGRPDLLARVLAFAGEVEAALPGQQPAVRSITERAGAPLRVALAGRVKAGKSTLLNALVGDELAPTDAGECTRIVTWYTHGPTYRVLATDTSGATTPARFDRADGAIDVQLDGRPPESFDRLTIEWPIESLRSMTLIDTPGTASASASISAKSIDFVAPDDEGTSPADAVVYLLRHLHATDVSFLQTFRDDEFSSATPVNCLGVLSRADEVAVGRLDAMESATRIADRYSRDPRLRRLVQTVVPVAGLLAQASTSLRDVEYRHLRLLADADASAVDRGLLSIDRFVAHGVPDVELDEFQREQLLDRFGLFGVRWCVDAIRAGRVTSAPDLAALLSIESGLDRLRSTLHTMFGARADTLKARSALLALQRLLATDDDATATLHARCEELWAGAHELRELELIDRLRAGDLGLSGEQADEAERLLGAVGTHLSARLGPQLDDGADASAVLLECRQRWQVLADSPVSSRALSALASAVVRTCEGLYADLAST